MNKEKNVPKINADLHERIGKIPVPEPSGTMDAKFRLLLREEKKRILVSEPVSESKRLAHPVSYYVMRIAAGIALFLSGWFTSSVTDLGNNRDQLTSLGNEVYMLRETLVLAMVQQNSPVERIKAVQMASQFEADDRIIESLIRMLGNDDNDNVRLMALEALVKYADKPEVREKLISTISMQSSPMVQLRLAELMRIMQEKRSVPEFQKVLLDVHLNYTVRSKIDETVRLLIETV
jgi:hypothetical protein